MHLQLGCCSHGSQGWAGRQTCSRKLRTAHGPWRFVTELCEGGVEGRAVCGWPHCLLLAASHCERQRHALAAGHQEFNGAAPWLLGAVDGVSAAGSSVVPHRRGTALHTSQARSCSETPGCAPTALTDHCPVLLGHPPEPPLCPHSRSPEGISSPWQPSLHAVREAEASPSSIALHRGGASPAVPIPTHGQLRCRT